MTGAMIVGMGLPGSGKSSVFGALFDLLARDGVAASLYREPEESDWPLAVTDRDTAGYISALTWFRAQRVPGLYRAQKDRAAGKIALVDSYYDKLVSDYIDQPGFEWLIQRGDPYRIPYREILRLDRKNLPDADCVVTFEVEKDHWTDLIRGRGRALDRKANIDHSTQKAYIDASVGYCSQLNIPHVLFKNVHDKLLTSAEILRDQLRSVGILQ